LADKFNEEERQKLIEKQKLNDVLYKEKYDHVRGENSPNWVGDLIRCSYPREFNKSLKEKIRKRDDFCCQLCKKNDEDTIFHVHHIDYHKKNCDLMNLILLCGSCNIKVNTNRGYWTGYFQEKMVIRFEFFNHIPIELNILDQISITNIKFSMPNHIPNGKIYNRIV